MRNYKELLEYHYRWRYINYMEFLRKLTRDEYKGLTTFRVARMIVRMRYLLNEKK